MNKKSLLHNLKTTKKANVIKAGAKNEGTSTRKAMTATVGCCASALSMSAKAGTL